METPGQWRWGWRSPRACRSCSGRGEYFLPFYLRDDETIVDDEKTASPARSFRLCPSSFDPSFPLELNSLAILRNRFPPPPTVSYVARLLAPYSPSAKEAAFAGLLIAVAGFFSFSQNLVVDGFGECTEMASFSGKNERGEMMNLISNAFFCSRFVTFLAMPRGLVVRSRLPSKKNIHISSDVAEPAVASAPADAPGPRGKHRYRQILMTSGCERRRDGTRRTE